MVGRFRSDLSGDACKPVMGKPLGSFHILRYVVSSLESMYVMVVCDSVIRQCKCTFLKMSPYRTRRCFIPGERGVDCTASLMLYTVFRV